MISFKRFEFSIFDDKAALSGNSNNKYDVQCCENKTLLWWILRIAQQEGDEFRIKGKE